MFEILRLVSKAFSVSTVFKRSYLLTVFYHRLIQTFFRNRLEEKASIYFQAINLSNNMFTVQ